MPILENIQGDLKEAIFSKDDLKKEVIRMLLAEIHNAEIIKKTPLTDEEIVKVIAASAKKRKEAIVEYQKGNRTELVDKEQKEMEILQKYLPAQASEEEINKAVLDAITKTGAQNPADIGKVMGVVTKQLAGRADGAQIAVIVKKNLGA